MSESEKSNVVTWENYCDECKRPVKFWNEGFRSSEATYKQIVGGICLDFSGGYDEFNDMSGKFASGEDYTHGYVALCHDCTALLYAAIPNAVAKFGLRLHPPEDDEGDKPCCRWSWTLRNEDGKLELFIPDETAEKWIKAPS